MYVCVCIHTHAHRHIRVCVCSGTQLCLTLCNPVDCTCRAPLSMEFPRQEYWNGLLFPTPGDLPDPGIVPAFLASPALAGGFFHSVTWEAHTHTHTHTHSHTHCWSIVDLQCCISFQCTANWFSYTWKKWIEVIVAQSCLTLCDPMDYIVQGILQARIPDG